MSVRKSCYTCKHYENHGICQLANRCIDCSEWEISDVYREAETVPVVTEKAEPIAAQIFKAQNHDAVSHPSHYCKGGVECLDAIKAALGDKYEGFLAGNVLKYVYRYPDKNGVEDCEKARFYLEKLIEVLENGR